MMDDKTYEKMRTEIRRYVDKWVKILGLDNFIITSEYCRGVCEECPDRGAITVAYWDYQEATITFYLGALAGCYKTIEHLVVHELVHILLAPEQTHIYSEHSEQMEYTTECVAKRFLELEKKNG